MAFFRDIANKFIKQPLTQEAASALLFKAIDADDGPLAQDIVSRRNDAVYWPGFGADPEQKAALIPFDYALKFDKRAAAAGMAAALPALLTEENDLGRTRLFFTVSDYLLQDTAVLLHIGADHQHRDKAGNTLLHAASVFSNGDDIFKLLRPYFPDADVKNTNGETSLMTAAAKDARSAIVTLLGWGADINATDNNGLNATMHALANKKFIMAAALMARGGDVDFANPVLDDAAIRKAEKDYPNFARQITEKRAAWEQRLSDEEKAVKSARRQQLHSNIVDVVSGGAGEMAAPKRAAFRKKHKANEV